MERLCEQNRIRRATPRELRALGDSIDAIASGGVVLKQLADQGTGKSGNPLAVLIGQWDGCADLGEEITQTLVERPPIALATSRVSGLAWMLSSTNGVPCVMAGKTG